MKKKRKEKKNSMRRVSTGDILTCYIMEKQVEQN